LRDKPTFDELEPPVVVTSLIDGLTDEQWADQRLRAERNLRIACGVVLGCFVGLFSIWHWGLARSHFGVAPLLVLGGSMILFGALLAQRRDDEALDYAGWIAFPEYKFFEALPWWVIGMIVATALAMLVMLVAIIVIGHFPAFRR
jgi:hypothetical protein